MENNQNHIPTDHLLPPPEGQPLPEAGPLHFDHLQHQRDIRLGRKITALMPSEDNEPKPVLYTPREQVSDAYKHLSRDAATEVHKNKHLMQEAETSEVTGRPNRKAYNRMIDELINGAETGGKQDIAVALLDLENFKLLNDSRGHEFGNQVLKAFGDELELAVRDTDIVVHFSGDEFGVVMPTLQPRNDGAPVPKDKLQERLTARFRSAASAVSRRLGVDLGTSVGIGIFEPGDNPSTLLDKADAEMYKDKRERKAGR